MRNWLRRGELKLKNSRFFASRTGAKRVFYPGCSLPGADPDFCLRVYDKLLERDPDLGIWFDCCAKPLRLKKDRLVAEKEEQALLQSMLDAGVEEVITACGNCFEQFSSFVAGKLRVIMIYDVLHGLELSEGSAGWTIHHPCFSRVQPQMQESVFRLADRHGFTLKNRDRQDHPLACCLHKTKKATQRRARLKQEKLLTYCAHCVMSFQREISSRHLLQELLGSTATWSPQGKLGLFANYRRFCKLLKGAVVRG
jgi:hypothetical protein